MEGWGVAWGVAWRVGERKGRRKGMRECGEEGDVGNKEATEVINSSVDFFECISKYLCLLSQIHSNKFNELR